MTEPHAPRHPCYSHDVLVHRDDDAWIRATRDFVARGLAAGGEVLVHGTHERVPLLQGALGSDPALSFGYDEEMYVAPQRTLFTYQRALAARSGPGDLWVTGTVPLGASRPEKAAWARYESAVNEALSSFPFHALCSYDAGRLPADVVAAARATHPTRMAGPESVASEEFCEPQAFLAHELAQVPGRPPAQPGLRLAVHGTDEMPGLRRRLGVAARAASAVPLDAVDNLVMAVHEVATNAVVHGEPPVTVTMWADLDEVVVEVLDAGAGGLDPLSGYRIPEGSRQLGLWVARQQVDDLFIDTPPGGGCRVLMIAS